MSQATAEPKPKTADPTPLIPPEEQFWQRYSPHHEFPFSVVGAIALAVVAVVLLVVLASRLSADDDVSKPVQSQLVEIDGATGKGDGLGLGDTPYKAGAAGRKEQAGDAGTNEPVKDAKRPELVLPGKLPKDPITFKDDPDDEPGDDGVFGQLKTTAEAAENSILASMNPVAVLPKRARPGGGLGDGKGKGSRGSPLGKGGTGLKGDGGGGGPSPHGVKLTTQAKRTMRWKILASDDGNIHLAKLKALGVTLIVPTRSPGVFQVFDLSQASLNPRLTDKLNEHKDKVWWTNRHPVQVAGMAKVLNLRETPPALVILLPKRLEDRMVVLEHEHQKASEEEIEQTVWDVPMANGVYRNEPEVVQQFLRKNR